MKALISSDWQAAPDNIDECLAVHEEILALREKLDFSVLVLAGDLKHSYDPIHTSVLNFMIHAISAFRKQGLELLICLGNHDRQGLYTDTKNWFPALRKAGARAYDKPSVFACGSGKEIRVLPYRNDVECLRREARELSRTADHDNSLLIFHADLVGARYNVLARSSEGIRVDDLHPAQYAACIGGHIHFQQNVAKNVWYAGSPFCTDWGEANQEKGYLLFDFSTNTISRVPSSLPGWFDPSWPNFPAERNGTSWNGTRIRLKVPIKDSQTVGAELEAAKHKAEKKYAGAQIIATAEFAETATAEATIQMDWPDRKKLEAYVEKTLPSELKRYRERILQYLIEQLGQAGGLVREGKELTFQKIQAKNFLSFEELNLTLPTGLCVVAGKNLDWKGRSNGSGKSGLLASIAVALFGMTFKGQKHDRWMRRGTDSKHKAFVGLAMRDAAGRKILVFRGRQPSKLLLKVNGQIVESGNRPEQTQREIENITGYTWETLSNAVYIDQTRAHALLTGTGKERRQLLSRLQNLERFERARKLVWQQRTNFEDRLSGVLACIDVANAKAEELLEAASGMEKVLKEAAPVVSLEQAKARWQEVKTALSRWQAQASAKREVLSERLHTITKEIHGMAGQLGQIEERRRYLEQTYKGLQSMRGKCQSCLQPVNASYVQGQLPMISTQIRGLDAAELATQREMKKLSEEEKPAVEARLAPWQRNAELEKRLDRCEQAMRRAVEENEQRQRQRNLIVELQARRATALAQVKENSAQVEKIRKWLQITNYAESVFARDGLPAFLNAQIMPQLNQSAAEYAELFSQKEIQVLFHVDEEGQMDVQVINAHGGKYVQDQSQGEMKVASLIVSFAVRAVAPKTNLLILDEPGDGLDPTSARQFANGLRQVVPRFGTILCVTHNPVVLSELAGNHVITVVKEDRVSRLEHNLSLKISLDT